MIQAHSGCCCLKNILETEYSCREMGAIVGIQVRDDDGLGSIMEILFGTINLKF